jgi:glycosyltransferase involved in cell wall biosynthesis
VRRQSRSETSGETISSVHKILIIGDAVAPTGFARVIRSIFDPLKRDFELHQLATRYDGRPHDYNWKLYQASKGKSPYGYDQVVPLIEEIQPAIVFLLYDIPYQRPYLAEILKASHRPRVVMYSPVESGPIAPELIKHLAGVTRYVLYTEYGRREIADTLNRVREDHPDFEFPALEVIPHGVDTERFYPLSNDEGEIPGRRLDARRAMKLGDAEHLEAFIILNANRNMSRKRIDLTMQGFAEFAHDKPANVKLYLHMGTQDRGWNVLILAQRYGIFDRLIMTQADNTQPQFSDQQLNLLYNACDVGITTTTGEGWGMVSFEHGATQAAQIVPRHTALADLWAGAAEFVEPVMKLTYEGNLTEAHIVSPKGVAGALQKLYVDREYRERLAKAAYQNATKPQFKWSAVAEKWKRLLDETLTGA